MITLTIRSESHPEWRPVADYEGVYEVSNEGDIRRVKDWAAGKGSSRRPAGLKRFALKRTGYLEVMLCMNRVRAYHLVHRVVARAFIGPCPEGHEVNHKDSNKANNRAENLEYMTRKENAQHGIRAGRRDHFVRDAVSGRYIKKEPSIAS